MGKISFNSLIVLFFGANLLLPCYADNVRFDSSRGTAPVKNFHQHSDVQLNAQDPQKTLNSLLQNIRDSQTLSPQHKEIISFCLIELSKIRTGRYVFQNIPEAIKVRIIPSGSGVLATYGSKTLSITDGMFKNILNPKSELLRRRALMTLTAVIAHELTHATQHHLKIGFANNCHPEDRATIRKFREMHALLEQVYATKELLELPFFEKVKQERSRNGELDIFPIRAEELLIEAGRSPEAARRSARTEFVRSYWSNTPSQPVKIGNHILYTSFIGHSLPTSENWNNTYNTYAFKWGRGKKHLDRPRNAIQAELRRFLNIVGLDLSPEFVMRKKAFAIEQESLIGYLDGVRVSEVSSLGTKGHIVKFFVGNELVRITHKAFENDGEYKGYYQDRKTLKAIYEIQDKKLSGIYREYDQTGEQILEIPFLKGKPHSNGWFVKNGEAIQIEFRHGVLIKNGKRYYTVKKNSKYWQKRYINENK